MRYVTHMNASYDTLHIRIILLIIDPSWITHTSVDECVFPCPAHTLLHAHTHTHGTNVEGEAMAHT